jgi:hypothetical protein
MLSQTLRSKIRLITALQFREALFLQIVVSVLSAIPVSAGLAGVVCSWKFPGFALSNWPIDVDSHFRFLSGIFLCVGVCFLTCVPNILRKTERFRLLSTLVFTGGLGRLLSLLVVGQPSAGHVVGLVFELVIVPLLVCWQAWLVKKLNAPRVTRNIGKI